MALPNIDKLARELAKFTKNKSKSKLSDKLDASTETIQMGEDEFTRHEPQITHKENNKMSAVSVAKLLKMLNSASKTKKGKHDPKEMLGDDGKDLSIKDSTKTYMKDEEVIDKQKLDEQEEIIRRITK